MNTEHDYDAQHKQLAEDLNDPLFRAWMDSGFGPNPTGQYSLDDMACAFAAGKRTALEGRSFGADFLASLREANLTRQTEWDPNATMSLLYSATELAGEVGEACNIVKKLERERVGRRGSRATKEQLAEELGDVIICVDLLAAQAGIDLAEATGNKFNATSEKYGLETRIETPGTVREGRSE